MTAGDDDLDFGKPGPVDRDPLTEGWKPGGDKGSDQNGSDKNDK
jgi:hypothetical protein